MLLHLPSAKDAGSIKENEEHEIMRQLSERLTRYVIKAGAVPEELYAVYQYGFQIGLEMLCCFVTCLAIAIYLHMIPEFIVFTSIFILLRTYAGGVHLNSFFACFLCSVTVQTAVMAFSCIYKLPIAAAWSVILICGALIARLSPVESQNWKLDDDEKRHCRKVTIKIVAGIVLFAIGCTLAGIYGIVSLIAMTVLVVFVSLYIGAVKYKIEKSKDMRR